MNSSLHAFFNYIDIQQFKFRMKNILASLSLVISTNFGIAQALPIQINGVIHELGDSTQFIRIIQNQDILAMVKSDSLGKYLWKSKVFPTDTLTISVNKIYFFENSATLNIGAYSIEAQLDFILIPMLILSLNSPFYEENVVESFSGFNLEYFKHSLRKYENYCIRFTHVSFSNESKLIAEQRKANFKKYLIDNGVNMDNIHFNSENLTLNCTTGDCRGRLEG